MRQDGGFSKYYIKKIYDDSLPTINIITVVYNDEMNIENTILSVINQVYPNIKYLIIDGASTDNTISIIKRYDNNIFYWLSEKDQGLYYAMNKGISLCDGDWLLFLNSGDKLKDPNVISSVFHNHNYSKFEIIYGDAEYVYPAFTVFERAKKMNEIWKGMICSHQSLFCKVSTAKDISFDLKYRFASDYKFVTDCFFTNRKFIYVEKIIASAMVGGITDSNQLKSVIERKNIISLREKSLKIYSFYNFLILYTLLIMFFKKFLPNRILKSILIIKNKILNRNRKVLNQAV